MLVGIVKQAHAVEEFWRVLISDWESDIKTGQYVEQTRVSGSVMIWEVVAEEDDNTRILMPTGFHAPVMMPVPTTASPELRPGDHLDQYVGGMFTRLTPSGVRMGLGDVVEKVTKAFGIEPCEGCQERKEKLNRLFPNVLKR